MATEFNHDPAKDIVLVKDGAVVQASCAPCDPSWFGPAPGGELVDADPGAVRPGMTWDGTAFAEPVPPPPTLADLKAAKLAAAVAQYQTRRDGGFPLPGGTDSLQARGADDQANWLTLKDACNEALAAGLGDQPCALPIRTTANATLACTYAEAATTLRGMRDWGAALMGRLWQLKDAIAAAADEAALAAIDLAAGWP